MRPRAIITINGQPVSGVFMERLISVTVNDREGVKSDSVDLELDAGPPYLAVPDTKAIIAVSLGYGAQMMFMGRFTADDIDLSCLPYTLKISGKSADMKSPAKQHGDKHYDDKSVKDIVGDLAKRMGISAKTSGAVGGIKLKWFALEGESPIHAVQRLAERVNGLATVKNGQLLFVERGAGQSAGGAALGTLVIKPAMVQPGSLSVKWTGRESVEKVKSTYHDRGKAKRETVEVPGDKKGKGTYTIRHNHANKDEAERAAGSKAKELERETITTSVTIEGNTAARAGSPMNYQGIHPAIDPLQFIIGSASHRYVKNSGYSTGITGKKKV